MCLSRTEAICVADESGNSETDNSGEPFYIHGCLILPNCDLTSMRQIVKEVEESSGVADIHMSNHEFGIKYNIIDSAIKILHTKCPNYAYLYFSFEKRYYFCLSVVKTIFAPMHYKSDSIMNNSQFSKILNLIAYHHIPPEMSRNFFRAFRRGDNVEMNVIYANLLSLLENTNSHFANGIRRLRANMTEDEISQNTVPGFGENPWFKKSMQEICFNNLIEYVSDYSKAHSLSINVFYYDKSEMTKKLVRKEKLIISGSNTIFSECEYKSDALLADVFCWMSKKYHERQIKELPPSSEINSAIAKISEHVGYRAISRDYDVKIIRECIRNDTLIPEMRMLIEEYNDLIKTKAQG